MKHFNLRSNHRRVHFELAHMLIGFGDCCEHINNTSAKLNLLYCVLLFTVALKSRQQQTNNNNRRTTTKNN